MEISTQDFRVVFWEIRDYSLGTKRVCPVLS